MSETRIYKGYWWLPSEPEEQIAGTLTIDSRGNVKLEIRSCYYCEMAYVNTYTLIDKDNGNLVERRQFDLDHFLPKGKCPCVGLSLYNFVPSCQVCNSRIKLDNMPDVEYDEYEYISPTSVNAIQ